MKEGLRLEELGEITSGQPDPEMMLLKKELAEEISHFLAALPKEKQTMFILRYWYAEKTANIEKQIEELLK